MRWPEEHTRMFYLLNGTTTLQLGSTIGTSSSTLRWRVTPPKGKSAAVKNKPDSAAAYTEQTNATYAVPHQCRPGSKNRACSAILDHSFWNSICRTVALDAVSLKPFQTFWMLLLKCGGDRYVPKESTFLNPFFYILLHTAKALLHCTDWVIRLCFLVNGNLAFSFSRLAAMCWPPVSA